MNEDRFETHSVVNQPPAYAGRNLLVADPVLRTVLDAVVDGETEEALGRLGGFCGSHEAAELAALADQFPPRLRTHDAEGRRLGAVDFHPAYHALMRRSLEAGLHSSLHETGEAEAGRRHELRAAGLFLLAQLERGHLSAVSATSAALSALAADRALRRSWAPKVAERRFDHRFLPPDKKVGLTLGIATTEKQAGTDLAALTTRAEPDGDGFFRLVGHKWFVTAPMSDALVVLAQTAEGLSAFLVPRFLGDGSRNAIRIERLKTPLGLRGGAIAEIEFAGAGGFALGDPGEGVRVLDESERLLRFDAAVVSAAAMRAGLAEAVHHARHRVVAGSSLLDKPLMLRLFADMALDVAAATALVLRLAHAFDVRGENETENAFCRLMTPAVKYWIAKSAPMLLAEAMEALGGNASADEGALARLYRDAPMIGMACGSGNLLALDVLRHIAAAPDALDAVLADFRSDLGEHSLVSVDVLRAAAKACQEDIGSARILVEQLAMTAAAAALRRYLPRAIGDAFLFTRLGGQWRASYGMLDGRFDASGFVDYMFPAQ